MLTVLPYEEYKKLLDKGLSEDSKSNSSFNWNDMVSSSGKYSLILDYVSGTDCRIVGDGSSRIAFYFPPGAYGKRKIEKPSCFKVAKAEKGVAQNKAEIHYMNKYGKKYACFPELYEYDYKNYFYELCEVGSKWTTNLLNPEEFFKEWNERIEKCEREKTLGNIRWRDCFETNAKYSFFRKVIGTFAFSYYDFKKLEEIVSKVFVDLALEHEKYMPIVSFLELVIKLRDELALVDFTSEENWALVERNGIHVPIPIDYGFTNEVRDKYYY